MTARIHRIALDEGYPVAATLEAPADWCSGESPLIAAPVAKAVVYSDPLPLIAAFFATLNAGHMPIVINPKLPGQQIEAIARRLGCMTLESDAGDITLSATDTDPAGGADTVDRPAGDASAVIIPRSGHHVFCTSGTTSSSGMPKHFCFSLQNSLGNARAHMASLGFSPGEGSRILLPLPVTHTFGMVAGVLGAMTCGAELFIVGSGITPQGLLTIIHQHNIDTVYLTPSLVCLLNATLARRASSLPSLRRISIGSSVCHAADLLQLARHIPHADMFVTYGLTEMGPRVSTFAAVAGGVTHPSLGEGHLPVPIGFPIDGVRVRVREGLLQVNSPYRATDLAVDDEGYFNCQDRAEMDAEGLVRVLGRSDDTIIRSGVNIFPDEVEALLTGLESITGVALVPQASSRYGQVPVLVCECAAGASHEAIESAVMGLLQNALPDTHWPARILLWEALPRTALRKIQRKRIAQIVNGGPDA